VGVADLRGIVSQRSATMLAAQQIQAGASRPPVAACQASMHVEALAAGSCRPCPRTRWPAQRLPAPRMCRARARNSRQQSVEECISAPMKVGMLAGQRPGAHVRPQAGSNPRRCRGRCKSWSSWGAATRRPPRPYGRPSAASATAPGRARRQPLRPAQAGRGRPCLRRGTCVSLHAPSSRAPAAAVPGSRAE